VTILMRIINCINVTGRLCAVSVFLILIFLALPALAAERASDEFLTGYVASVIERDLRWERNSYTLKIVNGVAVITLFKDDPARREAADKQLRAIDGLQKITIVVKDADAAKPGLVSRSLGITGDGEGFPTGDVFRPLLADPKQPQFFVSFDGFKSSGKSYTMASVGFGETFGIYRFFGSREGDGLQLSVEGALFAQFNMNTASHDLINADYTIGIPLTYRLGDNSLRLRIYHQSSHLGDEYLLSANHEKRVNLSYEALELIYSREWRGFRVYGGGEYLVDKDPADLKPIIGHWGIEYRHSKPLVWIARPIAGVDMKSLQEHKWAVDISAKAGFDFGNPNPGQRNVRLMAEYYKGFDPRGQFYKRKVEYYGLGLSLGF
jgi:hypothetical protein